jgi:hypothetical protein
MVPNFDPGITPEDSDPTVQDALDIINGITPPRKRRRTAWLRHAPCHSPFCVYCACAECCQPLGGTLAMTTRPPSPAVKRVLAKFIAWGKHIEPRGDGWRVQCPAADHLDLHPSCDLDFGTDGRALLKCRSKGCTQEAMIAGLGLPERDLFLTPDELREWGGQGGGGYSPTTDPNSRTADKITKDTRAC